MDWLGKFMNLPEHFLPSGPGNGGGIIQGSASESILVAVLAAREEKVREMKIKRPELTEGDIRSKLIGYGSIHSNSAIEKSGLLAATKMRLLEADEHSVLRGETVQKAIEADLADDLIPYICVATIGTTGTCAFDNMEEIGPVCKQYNVWMHIGMSSLLHNQAISREFMGHSRYFHRSFLHHLSHRCCVCRCRIRIARVRAHHERNRVW
jgi:glutamate/tyrosine decarboxylase-like PLP-dependent enzyme